MSEHEIPPLPRELERAVAELGAREPSAALSERLEAAIRGAASRAPEPAPRTSSIFPWLVPLSAAALLAVRVGGEAAAVEETLLSEEHHVELDEEGLGWVDVDVDTQHHDDAAFVRFDTPASMELNVGQHAQRIGQASCVAERCSHRFVRQRGSRPMSVRLGVSGEGTHRVRVTHTSRSRVVHEHIVVHAH